jgi:hypothetical protein
MTIEVITVDPPAPLHPFEPPNLLSLSGIEVRAQLGPGDQIAAIVKDHDGRVLGYVAQSEADRVRAMPDAATVRGYMVRIERMLRGGSIAGALIDEGQGKQ